MFISHKYKTIFVHIQRTGGNSINQVFQQYDPDLIDIVPIAPEKQRTRHCYMIDIKQAISTDIFNRYTKFSVVRNPYDRLVSWFVRFQQGPSADQHPAAYPHPHVGLQVRALVAEYAPDFERFLQLPKDHETGLFRRFHTPQFDYISDEGELMVDTVLRFENLATEFKQFANELGFEGHLPHINRAKRDNHYHDYYTEQTKAVVAERFKIDSDYFGYQF